MTLSEIVNAVANISKDLDSERPTDQKKFQPGIGPFREVQLVREIAKRLTDCGVSGQSVVAGIQRTPDMSVQFDQSVSDDKDWALEFKIIRPFGDNGRIATNWSRRLLYPYQGNESLMGDALKLQSLDGYQHTGLVAICFEHNPPRLNLEPILASFELITRDLMNVRLGDRIEEKSKVDPISWTVLEQC